MHYRIKSQSCVKNWDFYRDGCKQHLCRLYTQKISSLENRMICPVEAFEQYEAMLDKATQQGKETDG